MRTFIFYIAAVILIILSGCLAIKLPGSVDKASGEIITLISILSAAVISCIFSVSKYINMAHQKQDKKALYYISSYWIRFFCICSFCAVTTILGKILSWPTIELFQTPIDILGFLSASSLSIIAVMLFVDFPKAIRDLLSMESNIAPKEPIAVEMPKFKDNPNHGRLK